MNRQDGICILHPETFVGFEWRWQEEDRVDKRFKDTVEKWCGEGNPCTEPLAIFYIEMCQFNGGGGAMISELSKHSVHDIHQMDSEEFLLSESAATTINKAKAEGRRVISIGTTCVRLLESSIEKRGLQPKQIVSHGTGSTNLFIRPGHEFKIVDGLVSNFHLPKSTLLLLVSAMIGKENLFKAYNHAINNDYRFYSFGDAMLMI